MENLFVPYKESLQLKELGFNESCLGLYINTGIKPEVFIKTLYDNHYKEHQLLAPLYSQAFKWFRDKFHIHGEPFYKGGLTKKTSWYDYQIYSDFDFEEDKIQYKTYEEAELECLKQLIKIVQDEQASKI